MARKAGAWGPAESTHIGGVEAPAVFADVDEDGFGAKMDDGRGGGDPVGVGEDDLVAGTDAERGRAHVQGAGAAGGGVINAQVGFEGVFNAVDVVVAALARPVAATSVA